MKVAAEHAEAVGERAGNGMEERLFLDRVALHAADVSPGNIEFAPAVVADLADAGLAIGDRAGMSTGIAAQPIAVERLDQLGSSLAHVGVEDVFKSRHLRRFYCC